MPKQKDLKRLVRSRMQKTGEAYTAARRQVLQKSKGTRDYAALAGRSDAVLSEATGKTWEQWVRILERARADDMTHGEIAAHVRSLGTPSWWPNGGRRLRAHQRPAPDRPAVRGEVRDQQEPHDRCAGDDALRRVRERTAAKPVDAGEDPGAEVDPQQAHARDLGRQDRRAGVFRIEGRGEEHGHDRASEAAGQGVGRREEEVVGRPARPPHRAVDLIR